MMPKYIVKDDFRRNILYNSEVEADSREEAEEIALGEPVHQAESYVEVEESEEDWNYDDSLFSYWSW